MILYALGTRLGKLKLNLAFDNVLRVYDLQRDEVLEDIDKIDISLSLLVKNYWRVRYLSYDKKINIFTEIFKTYISVKSKSSGGDEKVFDFNQDSNHIYASFMLDYGIDLVEQQGKLDWRKFIALFQGLSNRTKIREVISIRTRKIPEQTTYNQEEIQALLKAKAYYALEFTEEEMEEQFQRGLDKLANALESRAVNQNAKS